MFKLVKIFGMLSLSRYVLLRLAANVSHIAEGGEYEAFKLKQMFKRSTTVHFSTKPPLLAICVTCWCFLIITNFKPKKMATDAVIQFKYSDDVHITAIYKRYDSFPEEVIQKLKNYL